jgi:hypothetical protein
VQISLFALTDPSSGRLTGDVGNAGARGLANFDYHGQFNKRVCPCAGSPTVALSSSAASRAATFTTLNTMPPTASRRAGHSPAPCLASRRLRDTDVHINSYRFAQPVIEIGSEYVQTRNERKTSLFFACFDCWNLAKLLAHSLKIPRF